MTTETDSLTVAPRFTRSTIYPIVRTGLFVASTLALLGLLALLPGIGRVSAALWIPVGTAVFVAGATLVGVALVRLASAVATVVAESLVGPDEAVADAAATSRTGLLFCGLLCVYLGLSPLVATALPGWAGWLFHGGFTVGLLGLGAYTLWRGWDVAIASAPSLPALPARGTPTSAEGGTRRTTEAPSTDDPPLTDAEQVKSLLESHDGRMRQADIVDELGWSASKVSRVLGEMADEGEVEKLRLGRENLIDLPEDRPGSRDSRES